MREELRLESGRHPARANTQSDFMMMLRIDRAAVWRSVPLRRGLMVLALMPGVVALAGNLEWQMLTILPGLVASGGALLFGVNTWCLDGRGALWRDSLPVAPRVVFISRSVVLMEVLLCTAAVTLCLAALRAGQPTAAEVVALICSTVVVTAQVVAAGMRWSIARPFAVDLRSARATPAPPVVMAGYSARLAMATTVTGLVFSGLAQLDGDAARGHPTFSGTRSPRSPSSSNNVGATPCNRWRAGGGLARASTSNTCWPRPRLTSSTTTQQIDLRVALAAPRSTTPSTGRERRS